MVKVTGVGVTLTLDTGTGLERVEGRVCDEVGRVRSVSSGQHKAPGPL